MYYLSGYVKAFRIHGDGDPYLLYYEDNGLRAIYVYMRRKTALEGVFDSVTPYGYGGVLFEGDASEANRQAFWKAYLEGFDSLDDTARDRQHKWHWSNYRLNEIPRHVSSKIKHRLGIG